MRVQIGRSFDLDLRHGGIFLRLWPFGQLSCYPGQGLCVDSWSQLRETGEV
jgi:hypothetical protein